MFSQLGPLFKTTLRQAEKSDTRLEIRREEKEQSGKKDDSGPENEEPSLLWEDTTGVSVEALRAFLIEFLKTRGDQLPPSATQVQPDQLVTNAPVQQPTRMNTMAARASQAYASTATHLTPPPPIEDNLPEPEQAEEDIDLVSLLKADELRTIHVLIHELDLLARRGVQNLTIEKADTFLESLVQAVRLQKIAG